MKKQPIYEVQKWEGFKGEKSLTQKNAFDAKNRDVVWLTRTPHFQTYFELTNFEFKKCEFQMSDLQLSSNNLVRMNQAKSTAYAGYFI